MSIAPIRDVAQAQRLGGRSIPEDKIARSWEICNLLFPEQQHAWQVHANSPLVFSTIWATMSLFKTSAHVPQRLIALATFGCMMFSRSGNWFAGDATATLLEEGFSADQSSALLAQTLNVRLAEFMGLSVFDKKENNVLALAYHLVWCSVQKAIDGGNSERMEKVRCKVREQLLESFSPLQTTELTWRVSVCMALIATNDFLVGDGTAFVSASSSSSFGSSSSSSSSLPVSSPVMAVLDPQTRFRTASVSAVGSPLSSPGSAPSSPGGRGAPRSRSGSVAGRGRGMVSVNPYDEPAPSSSSAASSPSPSSSASSSFNLPANSIDDCNVCDSSSKRTALRKVRGHEKCPFCKSIL